MPTSTARSVRSSSQSIRSSVECWLGALLASLVSVPATKRHRRAARTTIRLCRWKGSEDIQKRERGPGCGDLALPSLDVQPSGGDHPKPDEREGQADEIDPKTASDEHAGEPEQRRRSGQAHPDEEHWPDTSQPAPQATLSRAVADGSRPSCASEKTPTAATAHGTHRSSPPSQGAMKLIATEEEEQGTRRPRNVLRRTTSPFVSLRRPLALITWPTIGIRYHGSPRRDGRQPGSSWVIASICFGQNSLWLNRFEPCALSASVPPPATSRRAPLAASGPPRSRSGAPRRFLASIDDRGSATDDWSHGG